jgi:hypothetical protein
MGTSCKLTFILGAAAFLIAANACAQDSPSLGDVARQQRLQKEQSDTAPGKDAAAPRVITNEEIPEHTGPEPAVVAGSENGPLPASAGGVKQSAERWKAQILAQKAQIASLQKQMDKVNQSPFCEPRVRWPPMPAVERAAKGKAAAGRANAVSTGRPEETAGGDARVCPQTGLRQFGVRPLGDSFSATHLWSSFKPRGRAKLVAWL